MTTKLTATMIRRAVADLFTEVTGSRAKRLALVHDEQAQCKTCSGLCEEAIVDRLCEAFGVAPPRAMQMVRDKTPRTET